MKKQLFTAMAIIACSFAANAQVGIGTTTPEASSMLDVRSTQKGFLMPRMTTAERIALSSPVKGLEVFDITTNTPWYHNGTIWVNGASSTATTLYTGNGTIGSARTVAQGANTLAFTASAVNAFSVDGSTFSIDASNHRVGIGTTAPAAPLDIASKYKFYPAGTGSKSDPVLVFGNNSNWQRITSAPSGGPLMFWGDGNGYTNDSPNLAIQTNGNVGIGVASPSTLLHVNGVITATKIQGPSDSRFKKNIKPIENALQKVMKLGGYTYDWREASEFPNQTLGKGHDMGVIAQEVEKQFPEAVSTNAEGFKAVSYTELVPALIEAIKAQQAQIDALKAEVAKLKK